MFKYKTNTDTIIDSKQRSKLLLDLLRSNNASGVTLDLLLDLIENILLDFKSVTHCNSNRHVNNFYETYSSCLHELSNLRPSYSDFSILKTIGQGAFGQVQLARHRESGQLHALKILNKAQMVMQEGSIYWMLEKDIMQQVQSRWTVSLIYAFQDPVRLYLAMEYLPGGTFANWIAEVDAPEEAHVQFYAAELVLAISTLHDYNFLHRDIKPDNILIDIRGHLKLSDFGSCVRLDPDTRLCVSYSRAVGTPDYISPEVLHSQCHSTNLSQSSSGYGCEVDWWAFGVMLYEIYYGEAPFFSDDLATTYSKIMAFNVHLNFEPDGEQLASDNAVQLIKGLICDRRERLGSTPHATDLKQNTFFFDPHRKWTWDNIHEHQAPISLNLESECDTSMFESVDEEDNKKMNSREYCRELSSKVFSGENLQFSGFSYSPLSKMIDESVTNNKPISTSNPLSQAVQYPPSPLAPTDTKTEEKLDQEDEDKDLVNIVMAEEINRLVSEQQDLKDIVDKLTVEKYRLENALETESGKLKASENVTQLLQKNFTELLSKHALCEKTISNYEEETNSLLDDISKLKENQNTKQSMINRLKDELIKSQEYVDKTKEKIESLEHRLIAKSNEKSVIIVKNLSDMKNDEDGDSDCDINETKYELDRHIKQLTGEISKLKEKLNNKDRELTEISVRSERIVDENRRKNQILEELITRTNKQGKEIETLQNVLDENEKMERTLNLKIARLMKVMHDDRAKYESQLEIERNNYIRLENQSNMSINDMEKQLNSLTDSNENLQQDLKTEKIKCSELVVKIEQIITGKSSTANEMMLKEKEKRGLLSKKETTKNLEIVKANKKLQRIMQEQERRFLREKEDLESQITALREEIEIKSGRNKQLSRLPNNNFGLDHLHFDNDNVFTNDDVSSEITYSMNYSETSTNKKPPPLPPSNRMRPSLVPTESSSVNQKRMSNSSMTTSNLTNLPSQNLDMSIKKKGKKINWEKRIVKVDEDFLHFYTEHVTPVLQLPLSCILFVRPANQSHAIHVKSSELSRVFYITYDRVHTLLVAAGSGNNASTTPRDGPSSASTFSLQRFHSRNSVNHDETDTSDKNRGSGNRKSSLSRIFPNTGNNNHKSRNSIANKYFSLRPSSTSGNRNRNNSITGNKNNEQQSMLDLMNNPDLILMKGHTFLPMSRSNESGKQINTNKYCAICRQPLVTGNPIGDLDDPSNYRSVIDKKFCDLPCVVKNTNKEASPTSSGSGETSNNYHNKSLHPEYLVNNLVGYSCVFCGISCHGYDIDDAALFVCQQSVAMQLCRAKTDQEQQEWIHQLNRIIDNYKSQTK